ncbi:MAG: crossover junction endodeoxyribonuclease RuvC [Alphaproteobacteria bacterium]|jgi:crossover junction endodeoxyribonuclease RuvC|nr:crossover junction endodeoxyribonuclease RuvC [Alphaproteobacteria bacterium]
MRILGIDTGLNFTGWGIIETSNNSVKFIDCGVINPPAKNSDSQRLHKIYEGLKEVIINFNPEVVAIEETFVNNNPKGALKLGYARGVALMIPSIYALEVFEYAPTTIKKTVAGNGHASKEQVKAMLKFIMPNIKEVKDDAIDAVSIALCHSYHKYL